MGSKCVTAKRRMFAPFENGNQASQPVLITLLTETSSTKFYICLYVNYITKSFIACKLHLGQTCQTRGPQAASRPIQCFMRPDSVFELYIISYHTLGAQV